MLAVAEELIFKLIMYSGAAKSEVFEAFACCKEGKYEDTERLMMSAKEKLLQAHNVQNNLIQQEVNGEPISVSMLMVHAQDHLMNAIFAKEVMLMLMEMQKEINQIKLNNLEEKISSNTFLKYT